MKNLSSKKQRFTFIDLFAGIGGFHLAMHRLGGKCVYASEWDKYARTTYEHNFRKIDPELFEKGMFTGDITLPENKAMIPEDFDVLCAGFPCQPFSQAGYKRGFEETRGTLFFDIADIIATKRPKSFFLENVRNLQKHDDGKTIEVIENTLRSLGYSFDYKLIRASDFGLPTHRPRVFMIGIRDDIIDPKLFRFRFPDPIPLQLTMSDVLGASCPKRIGFTLRVGGRGSGIHDRRNWDSYLADGKVRVLTPKEGKRMMGFPDNFTFPVSDVQAMKQLGNSVAVNAIYETAKALISQLSAPYDEELSESWHIENRSLILAA